jgi:tetratricopeptide (TPR) repeat protein
MLAMGLFRRLFSSDFRKAVAAEAEGDYLAAARAYGLCGEHQKVMEMHLAQARLEQTLEGRIRELWVALDFTSEGDRRHPMVLRLLAGALRERAAALGAAGEGSELLEQAAGLLERGESWEQAGECYLELDDRQRAAAAFSKAGLVERVEQTLGEEDRRRRQELEEDSAFKDYEMHLQLGQRDQAAESLRGCIEAARDKGDYRRLLAQLEARLLTTGRITLQAAGKTLVLVGTYPLVLGRDADCDLPLRGQSLSRRHARVRLDPEQGLLLEDLGSRNGTTLGGLPLGSALPLPGSGVLGLGDSCELAFSLLDAAASALRLEVRRGMDEGLVAAVSTAPLELSRLLDGGPPLTIGFSRGRPLARAAGGELLLNGQPASGEVQLMQGDVLRLEDQDVRVTG